MFAAVSLMGERTARGERNSPMTIKNYLKSTCHVLDAVFNARGLIAIKEMRRNDVKAYIEGTYGKTAEKSTRIAYVRGYLAARDAQLRFLNSNNEFRDLLLPHPSDDCSIPAYHRYAENESRERRSTRVSALAPHYLNLLQGITKRAEAFQQIRRIYERHRAEFVDHREPVEFLVTLPDRSAELKFRIVDMFQRQYELDGNLMARQKGSSLEGKFVTEIRGIHGGNGGTFVEHLYSLRYAPDEVPRSSLKSLQKSDLKVAAPGLFFPAGTLGTFIRKQNRRLATTSIRAPVAVDLDAVCAGISLGSLLVLLSYAFPLRIHELQQIRREADYTFETAINCLLTTICPKGQKRDKKCEVEHYIHPYVLPFWMDFISILENAEWSVQRVAIQNAAEFGFEKGFHLFQWNGIALRQNVLTWLLRCSTHGLDLSSKGDKPAILTFHLLRHLYARTGIKFGRSKLDISESLGHRSPLSTQTYLDGLDDALLLHPDSIMSSLDAIIIHPLKGGAL